MTESLAFSRILCAFKQPSVFFLGPRVESTRVLATLVVPLNPNASLLGFSFISLFIQCWDLKALYLQSELHTSPDGLGVFPEDSWKIPLFQNSAELPQLLCLEGMPVSLWPGLLFKAIS